MREVMGKRRVRPCEGNNCKKMVRRFRVDKKTGKHLCYNCYTKTVHIINSDTSSSNTGGQNNG